MRYAIDIAPLGDLADPRRIAELGRAAEESGWDGLSIWDDIGNSMGVGFADPFVCLAAVASVTTRLRLIASVIILPRRRPQLVAQAAASVDLLSGGRLALGVGSGGVADEFEAFGEEPDSAVRAARLDEALPIVDGFLRGETVHADGPTYVVRGASVGPRSVQEPRPPIWIGGMRPAALRRAARWDGWIALAVSDDGSSNVLAPAVFGEMAGRIRGERAAAGRDGEPFEIAVLGLSLDWRPETSAAFAAEGATWWLESLSPMRGSQEELLRLVRSGPPRS
jgi:alkanesulfonate monooxygenase SsuD/methylene tetrahydromethanopterin reductase-like flavin-dependent oxidoreductase (luciferase family)